MSEITVRPIDETTERGYVHSTARRVVAEAKGGQYLHWPVANALVDRILRECEIQVATYADSPGQIVGWAARGSDGTLEWLYLRRSFDEAPKAAIPVVKALLKREAGPVTMRRIPEPRTLSAILAAGLVPSVVPTAI